MTSDSPPVTRFALLRQIEAGWNKDKWIQGQTNNPITQEEESQAKEWGRILDHFQWDRIITSEKGRAVETASFVNLSFNVPIVHDSRFNEQDWGDWTGKTIEQIVKEEPALFEEQYEAGWRFKPPRGEDNDTVVKRTLLALKEAHMKYIRENILVVIHEGLIRLILSRLLEDLRSESDNQVTVVFLSNQLHWLLCYKGEMKLEKVNALPLPLSRLPE